MSPVTIFEKKRIQRMPVNPHDKSTVVSICPFEIHEIKPTIFPGYFDFPAVKNPDEDFEILVIGPSAWYKDTENSIMEIQESSFHIARSLVNDYCHGLIGCNMSDSMPGLFFIPGSFNKMSILSYKDESNRDFKSMLESARLKQKNWYLKIVEETDVLWARTNGNPRVVGKDAQMGCKLLGLGREWSEGVKAVELVPCKACGQRINPNYPICMHCKAIVNPAKAKELGLQFAS